MRKSCRTGNRVRHKSSRSAPQLGMEVLTQAFCAEACDLLAQDQQAKRRCRLCITQSFARLRHRLCGARRTKAHPLLLVRRAFRFCLPSQRPLSIADRTRRESRCRGAASSALSTSSHWANRATEHRIRGIQTFEKPPRRVCSFASTAKARGSGRWVPFATTIALVCRLVERKDMWASTTTSEPEATQAKQM